MDLDCTEERKPNQEDEAYIVPTTHMYIPCPNCQSMMNELGRLQREFVERMERRRERKYFSIAHTVYTFYPNKLEKHNILRLLLTIINSSVG